MKILTLKQKLYAGLTPDDLGMEKVGEGCQKAAYKIDIEYYGPLIVKTNTGGWRDNSRHVPKAIKNYHAREAKTWFTGKWMIQEYVTPLCDVATGKWNTCDKVLLANWKKLYKADLGDMHQYNCGFSAKNELVVFDW